MVATRSSSSTKSSSHKSTGNGSKAKPTSSSSTASTCASTPHPSKPKATGSKSGSSKFPYDLPYASLDLRTHPHLYRTGIGEQGVLMVEPYKSEILPHWRFKNPPTATASSSKLLSIFESYISEGDFVGADMTRKFIQMGYTRARRYANHKGGKKYVYPEGKKREEIKRLEVADQDAEKVEAARIFKAVLDEEVWTNKEYVRMREEHIAWAKQQPVLTEDSAEVKDAVLSNSKEQREVTRW